MEEIIGTLQSCPCGRHLLMVREDGGYSTPPHDPACVLAERRRRVVLGVAMESSRERRGLDFSPALHSPSATWPNGRRRTRPRRSSSAGSKR